MEQGISISYNKVDRNVKLSREAIIRFQLMAYILFNSIPRISERDMNCLTLLGLKGKPVLINFCQSLVEYNIFASIQSARNAISVLQDKKMICKEGGHPKLVYLCPDMDIRTTGSIFVNFNLFTDVPYEG